MLRHSCLVVLSLLGAALSSQVRAQDNGCRDEFFEKRVQAYDPIYFVVGNDSQAGFNAKFQISVDFEIFCKSGMTAGSPMLEKLQQFHLGFSQTSIWDLSELSSPFRDSSYRPRLFYRFRDERTSGDRWLSEFDAGFAHESNGKAGLDSRSINMLFVRPKYSFGLGSGGTRRLNIQPMIYAYTEVSNNNRDIADYRGHVDLHVEYLWGPVDSTSHTRKEDPWIVWLDARKGTRGNLGSVDLVLAAPYRSVPLLKSLRGWLMLEYFAGYGENLLEYNVKHDSQLRAGFCVVF